MSVSKISQEARRLSNRFSNANLSATSQYSESVKNMALDKVLFQLKSINSFLFLHENICCGYSLEAPCRGASNEYPQYMFCGEIRKISSGYPCLSGTMEE